MNKIQQQKDNFLENMLEEVANIPVAEVVGSVVDLVPRGRHLMGLCPFHPDHNLGSFVVTPDKNIWRCFADGIGGTPAKFVAEYEEISYLDAAFKLAREYNIISDEEYEFYSGKRYNAETVQRIQKRLEEPVKTEDIVADEKVIACVYNSIARVCGLSEAHKKHLRKERFLSEDKWKDYFTFPTRRMDLAGKVFRDIGEQISMSKFQKPLKKLSKEEQEVVAKTMRKVQEQMIYVPGFYLNNNTGAVDFMSSKGIGIINRDDRNMPVGIEIRRDTVKPGESRYIRFSSAFAKTQSYASGGASSGSSGGFIGWRGKTHKKGLCITEGRFKAEKIADAGFDVAYVSGVSSWRSIIPIIRRNCVPGDNLYLMFDADMLGNTAVYKQLSALYKGLLSFRVNIKLILWCKENGKGFDDLVINKGHQYAKYLKCVSYRKFDTVYQKTLTDVLDEYSAKSVRDIQKDDAKKFEMSLQRRMEDNVELVRDI